MTFFGFDNDITVLLIWSLILKIKKRNGTQVNEAFNLAPTNAERLRLRGGAAIQEGKLMVELL